MHIQTLKNAYTSTQLSVRLLKAGDTYRDVVKDSYRRLSAPRPNTVSRALGSVGIDILDPRPPTLARAVGINATTGFYMGTAYTMLSPLHAVCSISLASRGAAFIMPRLGAMPGVFSAQMLSILLIGTGAPTGFSKHWNQRTDVAPWEGAVFGLLETVSHYGVLGLPEYAALQLADHAERAGQRGVQAAALTGAIVGSALLQLARVPLVVSILALQLALGVGLGLLMGGVGACQFVADKIRTAEGSPAC